MQRDESDEGSLRELLPPVDVAQLITAPFEAMTAFDVGRRAVAGTDEEPERLPLSLHPMRPVNTGAPIVRRLMSEPAMSETQGERRLGA
jgi:hypothetical protein